MLIFFHHQFAYFQSTCIVLTILFLWEIRHFIHRRATSTLLSLTILLVNYFLSIYIVPHLKGTLKVLTSIWSLKSRILVFALLLQHFKELTLCNLKLLQILVLYFRPWWCLIVLRCQKIPPISEWIWFRIHLHLS